MQFVQVMFPVSILKLLFISSAHSYFCEGFVKQLKALDLLLKHMTFLTLYEALGRRCHNI